MLKSARSEQSFQWQTLVVVVALFVIGTLLVQFFFLSEEIEDTRSRNVKLNIAEILAKQQKTRLEVASLSGDHEFSLAAEKMAKIDTSTGQRDVTRNQLQQQSDYRNSPHYKALASVVTGVQLVGVIRHEDYRVAIIQKIGSRDPLVYAEGELLSNGAIVQQVLDDAIVIQSIQDKDIRVELKISSTPLIGNNQASFNFLNLPGSK